MQFKLFVYDPPDTQGKSGFDLYWSDATGEMQCQCFRANVDDWIAKCRARGHEIEIVKEELVGRKRRWRRSG